MKTKLLARADEALANRMAGPRVSVRVDPRSASRYGRNPVTADTITISCFMITFNDQAGAPDFRVVQLTPHGSNSSIQFGVGVTDAPADSVCGLYLVVRDIEAYQRELTDRGLGVSEIRHKDTRGGWRGGYLPGLDPGRSDYASFADFRDPDGNAWVLQERGYHPT